MSVHIREAIPSDAHSITVAYRASRQEAFGGILPGNAVHSRDFEGDVRRWKEFAETGQGHLLVAEAGSGILGLAALEYEGSAAELGALYVHPFHYNNGVGRALLYNALACGNEDSHKEIVAWVLAANQRAKRFFLSRGGWLDGGVEVRQAGSSLKLTMQRIRFGTDRIKYDNKWAQR